MTITAKFASICPCCSQRIQVGSRVEWTKGTKARHVACAQQPGAASAPSRSPSGRGDVRHMDAEALAERGLVRCNGPHGTYVRRATREEMYDLI